MRVIALLAAVLTSATMAFADTRKVVFSGDEVGQAPKGFAFGHTANVGTPGKWVV
jgi:hypothetical protein